MDGIHEKSKGGGKVTETVDEFYDRIFATQARRGGEDYFLVWQSKRHKENLGSDLLPEKWSTLRVRQHLSNIIGKGGKLW